MHRAEGSKLGLLRTRDSQALAELSQKLAQGTVQQLRESQISFSKSSVRSRIHRQVYPDYVGIKLYNAEGLLCRKYRFLGL
ncbi:MAG: glutamate dehydrogenase, partial [Paraglaciecola psychrophila]